MKRGSPCDKISAYEKNCGKINYIEINYDKINTLWIAFYVYPI